MGTPEYLMIESLKEIIKLDFGDNRYVENRILEYYKDHRRELEEEAATEDPDGILEEIYTRLGIFDDVNEPLTQ